jgi:hypothetical protein
MELFCTEGDNVVPYLSSNTLMSSPALKVNSLSSAASKSYRALTYKNHSHFNLLIAKSRIPLNFTNYLLEMYSLIRPLLLSGQISK